MEIAEVKYTIKEPVRVIQWISNMPGTGKAYIHENTDDKLVCPTDMSEWMRIDDRELVREKALEGHDVWWNVGRQSRSFIFVSKNIIQRVTMKPSDNRTITHGIMNTMPFQNTTLRSTAARDPNSPIYKQDMNRDIIKEIIENPKSVSAQIEETKTKLQVLQSLSSIDVI